MIAIYSLISLTLIAWLLLVPMNGYRVDSLRQDLFAIRYQLFSDAANGRIRFDSPAYGFTRITLNGMLRFAHKFSFSRCATVLLMVNEADIGASRAQHERAFSAASATDREICLRYLSLANRRLTSHILSAPVLLFILTCVVPVLTLRRGGSAFVNWGIKKCHAAFVKLDALAFEEGKAVLAKDHALSTI